MGKNFRRAARAQYSQYTLYYALRFTPRLSLIICLFITYYGKLARANMMSATVSALRHRTGKQGWWGVGCVAARCVLCAGDRAAAARPRGLPAGDSLVFFGKRLPPELNVN